MIRTARRSGLFAAAAAAALALVACGDDPADPVTARARVEATLPALIDGAGDAFAFLDDSPLVGSMGDGIDAVGAAFPWLGLPASDGETGAAAWAMPLDEGTGDEESLGVQLARALEEEVFADANYEGDGVYLLKGADFCGSDVESGASDPACVADFDAAELRVRAVLAGDGLDATLLVGPDRAAPLAIEIRSDRLTLAIDLAEAKQAATHLLAITGEEGYLPETMEGVVALSLVRNAEADYSIEAAVREAIVVAGTQEGGGSFSVSTAAADPALSVRADGNARRLTLAAAIGRTLVSLPWSTIDQESAATGQAEIDLGGLSATAALEDGSDTLAITDIGLGDTTSTLKLDGETLMAVDLNAGSGRRFDLTVRPSATGLPTVAFSPALALALRTHLAPLAAAGDEVEAHLLDDTYTADLSGDAPALQPVAADESGFPGGVRVVSGRLTVASAAAAQSVVVEAGQCLVGDDPVEDGENEIIGSLAVVDCP